MKIRMRYNILFVLVMLTLTIVLSGCSGKKKSEGSSENVSESSQKTTEPTYGGEITVGIPQDLEDSLDPHKAVAAGTKEVLFNIFEGLYKPDSEGNLVPAVASDCKISEDGKTYTFTLREGVKFHDGNLVTVDDIKYSIDRCADTSQGEPLVSAYSAIQSVNIVDNKTVSVVLKDADPDFLAYMTTAIIPKNNPNPDTNPIGTGPFKYVSRSPQENIVLEKFNDYWGDKAYLDKITFKIIANADSIVMDLKGGSVDMYARLTASQAAELKDGFTVYEGTMNLVQALYLNNKVAPFDNVKVRQALCYAVNPEEIMAMIANGKGTEIGSSMFPSFKKYYMKELNDVYNTDVEKAKSLLKEAGYPDGFDMTITVPSNYQPHVDTAQVLVEELKQIGVNASIELVEWDSWLSDVYANRDYQSTVIGVDASSLSARALLERYTTDNSGNFMNYSNPKYDELFAKAIATSSDDERTQDYKDLETLLTDDAASVYIHDLANLVALNNKFGGYTFYPVYVQDMAKIYQVK